LKKTILITGAGGFVGSELVNSFFNLDYVVHALDKKFSYDFSKHKKIFFYKQDLSKYKKKEFKHIDYFIHAAAITSPQNVNYESSLVKENISLTKKSLELGKKLKIKKYFLISSTGVYRSNKSEIFNEKSDVYLSSNYSKSKLLAEDMVIKFCTKNKIDYKIFRLGNVYSGIEKKLWSRKNVSMFQKWLDSSKKDVPLETDSFLTKRDWTYIKDIPLMINSIIKSKNKKIKIINLVSPFIKTDLNMMKCISKKMSKKFNFIENKFSTINHNAAQSLYWKNFKFNKWTSPSKAITLITSNANEKI